MELKYRAIFISILLLAIPTIGGCANNNSEIPSYSTITSEEAKEMIDNNSEIIILDVRTEEEFSEGHIKDAILIPYNEILDRAEDLISDKEAIILVYCRSGRRSSLAADNLVSLGYTNVYDFGGIIDWTYEIVME